jgi:homoserine dehydrogenase
MYKNSILSSLAYKKRVPLDKIYREGISSVDVLDLEIGKELGYTMKLLAISKNNGKMTEARVHPAFLPNEHPLSAVKGSFNAVFINGDNVDDVMLYGRGAGSLPTGSAIVSDIVFAGKNNEHRRFTFEGDDVDESTFATDFATEYYLRFVANDTAQALSKITALIEDGGVSVVKALTKDGNVVLITGKTKESNMQQLVAKATKLSAVDTLGALVRIQK